jgi:hypothetical protein
LFFSTTKTKTCQPKITPSGRKVSLGEEIKRKERERKIVDTKFRDSERKPLGPKAKYSGGMYHRSGPFKAIT